MEVLIIGMGELGKAFYRSSRFVEGLSVKAYYDPLCKDDSLPLASLQTLEEVLHYPVDAYLLTAVQDKQLESVLVLAKTSRKLLLPLPAVTDGETLDYLVKTVSPGQVWLIPLPVYHKSVIALKKQIDAQVLGKIGVVEYSVVSTKPNQVWYHDIGVSGGCRYQLLLPLLYEITYLFGKVEACYGSYAKENGMDYAHLSMRLDNGILVSVETCWGSTESNRKTLEVSGEKGNIVFDSQTAKTLSLASAAKSQSYRDDSLDDSTNDPLLIVFQELLEGNQRFSPPGLLEFQWVLDACIDRRRLDG